MKAKIFALLCPLLLTVVLLGQSTTPAAPAPSGNQAQSCRCCNHHMDGGTMTCRGAEGNCCNGQHAGHHGHCPMMSKDGNKTGCCSQGNCATGKGKACCCGSNSPSPPSGT